MKHSFPISAVFLLALATVLLSACTPARQGASAQNFYASGRPNFSISVSPPLTLASTGFLSATVPADVAMPPSGTFRYALFAEEKNEAIAREAHTILSEVPYNDWRWEMETWSAPEVISYAKTRMAGKYWTIRMMPVFSSSDWFSALWKQNGKNIPEFWLAKRWSATPDEYIRIVAEYREPAPLCMQNKLAAASLADHNSPPVRGKELWHNCQREIDEFSARADTVFSFDKAGDSPAQSARTSLSLPPGNPNMGKLVGRAENIDRDSSYKN